MNDAGLLIVLQAAAGEKACYNSVVACGQQLLVLGTRSVHALAVRPWTDRVGHLVRQRLVLSYSTKNALKLKNKLFSFCFS